MNLYANPKRGNPWARPGQRGALALARMPGGVPELLNEARTLLDRVEDERNRLAFEVFTLRATGRVGAVLVLGPLGFLVDDPGGLETRASAYEGLIEQLERFVSGVFTRVEKKALAGDVAAAQRLRDSTARILGAAASSSPVEDLRTDVMATIEEALADLKATVSVLTVVAGAALALSGLNFLMNLGGRR